MSLINKILLNWRLLLTSTAVLVFCLIGNIVQASIQQPIYDTSSGALTGAQMVSLRQNFISPPETSPTTTITSITLRAKFDKVCGIVLKIRNTSLATHSSANVTTTAGSAQNYTFSFTTSSNFHTGNLKDWLYDAGTSIAGCTLTADKSGQVYGSANTSTYPNGYWNNTASTTPANQFFILNGSSVSSWISFTSIPVSTCDFFNFSTYGEVDSATASACGTTVGNSNSTGTCSVGVAYNSDFYNTSTYIYNNNQGVGGFNLLNFGANVNVPKYGTFVSGTVYNARAYICSTNNAQDCYLGANGGNSQILAESEDWSFIVNGLDTCTDNTYYSQSEIPPPETSTSTMLNYENILAQAYSQCDSFKDGSVTGGVVWGLCRALVAVFVPSQDSINNFSNLKTQLSAKPPFGYFSVYNSAMSDFENVTSTNSTISANTSTAKMQLSVWTGLVLYDYVYTAIEWVFYFIAGLYFYRRFKHLDF